MFKKFWWFLKGLCYIEKRMDNIEEILGKWKMWSKINVILVV